MNGRRRRDGSTRRQEGCREDVRHRQDLWMQKRNSEDECSSAELRSDGDDCGPAVVSAEKGSGFDE
jgi:hypothetical protein